MTAPEAALTADAALTPGAAFTADAAQAQPASTGTSTGNGPVVAASRARGQVGEFHLAYGLPMRDRPTAAVGGDQIELRQALIEEEVAELAAAARAGDLIGVADALADIVYVAYGTAHVYGIDLDAVLDAVHTSNMTKLGADGRPIRRADGKVLKGPDYRPPDIAAALGAL